MMKLNMEQKPDFPQAEPNGATTKKRGKSGKLKKLLALLLVLCVAVAGVLLFLWWNNKRSAEAEIDPAYTTAAVERRDITASITGSGTLQAANSYSVTTLLEGTILAAGFEEGDQVETGKVLYTIDSSDAASALEKAEISLNQSQRSYNNKQNSLDDLKITAGASGQVSTLEIAVGDTVAAGQTIATIQNSSVMSLAVSFPADDAVGFYLGQSATVTLDSTFETLAGTVSKISSIDTVLTGNMITREVTIDVENPGGISTSQIATAEVGGVGSSGSGTFAYADEGTITASVSGKVASVSIAEGDWVSKDQTIAVLASDTLEDEIQSASEAVRNSQLSLESQYDQLDNYTITSPISGTIIDKNYKAGETTEANKVLCTIYDLSYLTMTLNVDELDISNISVGQSVSLVADAVDGKTYEGVVTKVSVAGTSNSGVTTYPVTIRIDETEGLLPGMSADATIVLDGASNALTIPAAALSRGDQVLVTADSPSAANADTASNGQNVSGYISIPVSVGISDDRYQEILSGLQEGDTVAYLPTASGDELDMADSEGVIAYVPYEETGAQHESTD